jgi:transposase-like protein
MKDDKTVQQFIELRAQGITYARIAEQLGVSQRTLIDWSRRHQHLIHNLRTIEWETFVDGLLADRRERFRQLSDRLAKLEAELAGRDLTALPTPHLHRMIQDLRRCLEKESGFMTFSAAVDTVPSDEVHEEIQDWVP